MLVLNHELQPVDADVTYHSSVFAPVKPLVVYAPLARADRPELQAASEKGNSKVIVGDVWIDTLLPLAASNVWPKGTKFLIVENDYRIYKNDCFAMQAVGHCHQPSILGEKSMDEIPMFNSSAYGLYCDRSVAKSNILKDFLSIWTTASRIDRPLEKERQISGGYGNLVWFSWRTGVLAWNKQETHYDFPPRGPEQREVCPGVGLYCVGITKEAANYMLNMKVLFFLYDFQTQSNTLS